MSALLYHTPSRNFKGRGSIPLLYKGTILDMKVGVVGCGSISQTYLRIASQFPEVEVVAVADKILERARTRAEEFGVPKVYTLEQMFDDPEIELILNLTIPQSHAPINKMALEAGKHAYSEKPFGVNRQEAREVLELAKATGLRVGSAPDNFLSPLQQTCRRLIDEGVIGEPVGASAFMLKPGPEDWHPDPEFLYQVGGGPMLDMGPYYITALVNLLGAVRRVAGMSRITFPTRTITSQPKYGTVIPVETPTHITGCAQFANGAIATLIMSFDAVAHRLPWAEIYGTEGTLSISRSEILLKKRGESDWQEVTPQSLPYVSGLAEMIRAIESGRLHRANGELAYHVLDVMLAFNESSELGRHIDIESTCPRPEPLR